MAQTKPTSIFHQVQQLIADQLNSDEMLSAANVTFVAENSKAIDYEVQNALGKQGIVGVVMTPKADYIGITAPGELAYELRDLTIQIVENVPVNRGLPSSTTALDAAQRAQEILASPNFTTFGVMNPVSIEQGEDSGLIVCQAKFNCSVRAKFVNQKTTKIKYTAASGLPDLERDIVGELADDSIPNKSDAEVVEIGNAVSSIGIDAFDNCINLTSVTIPGSVKTIGNSAFFGCRALASVVISEGVETIDLGAFTDCRVLNNVTIPSSVTSILDDAFYNCEALYSITFSGKDKATVQGMSKYPWRLPSGCVIHCTDGDITI